MENKGLISVVVPVYNAENYLGECIDSIFAQTYANWELILVDDGSKDGSRRICEECAARDTRVKTIHQENAGVSMARNAGLRLCRGEYILFVDADDWVLPQMFERLVAAQTDQNAQFVACGHSKVDPVSGSRQDWPAEDSVYTGQEFYDKFGILYDKTLVSGPCFKLYLRSIIEGEGLSFDPSRSLGEDLTFNLQYYDHVDKVCMIPDCLYCYRNVPSVSLTTRFNPQKSEIQYELYQMVRKFCRRHHCLEENESHLNAVFFRQTYLQIQSICDAKMEGKAKNRLIKEILSKYMTKEFLEKTGMQSAHNRIVRGLMQHRMVLGLKLLIKGKNRLKQIVRR